MLAAGAFRPNNSVGLVGWHDRSEANRMSDYESLFADASQLPLSAEWLAEIEKRSTEYDAGGVKAVPWEQVRTEARKRLS